MQTNPRIPSSMVQRHRDARGISLIEILVVLAIIALMTTGVAILALKAYERSQYKATVVDVAELSRAVDTYRVEKGRCPQSIQDLVTAGVTAKVRKDPWGADYVMQCPGEHGDVDVASPGKDGELGTEDDVNSWNLSPNQE
jgi:general secretion pathway protein G